MCDTLNDEPPIFIVKKFSVVLLSLSNKNYVIRCLALSSWSIWIPHFDNVFLVGKRSQ